MTPSNLSGFNESVFLHNAKPALKDNEIPIFLRCVTHGAAGVLHTWTALPPVRATTEAAAYDICAYLPDGELLLHPLDVVKVPTGLFMALPKNTAALICSRSGLASKGVQVINAPGIVDSDYRDEVQILLSYIKPPCQPNSWRANDPFIITHGMRVAQMLIVQSSSLLHPVFLPLNNLNELPAAESNRTGGFGSTGVFQVSQ
jgi:dUTP pyrophosphatase